MPQVEKKKKADPTLILVKFFHLSQIRNYKLTEIAIKN